MSGGVVAWFAARIVSYPATPPSRPVHMTTHPSPHHLAGHADRGVYRLPFAGRDGSLLLVAINRHGHRVAEASVLPGQDAYVMEAALRQLLDNVDPEATLRLIAS